jgi:hypothetical protein
MDANALKSMLETLGAPPFIIVFNHADGTSEELLCNWHGPREETEPTLQSAWDAISDAIDSTADQTGIELTRTQMRALLERSGIMKSVIKYREIDTIIRGQIADVLALELVGEGWPTYGDDRDSEVFFERISESARSSGYEVN